MFILCSATGRYFGGFTLGLPDWFDSAGQASCLTARQAAAMSRKLRESGYEVRRQPLTR
jgi:hypothetical protein